MAKTDRKSRKASVVHSRSEPPADNREPDGMQRLGHVLEMRQDTDGSVWISFAGPLRKHFIDGKPIVLEFDAEGRDVRSFGVGSSSVSGGDSGAEIDLKILSRVSDWPAKQPARSTPLAVGNVYKCHGGGKTRHWVVVGIAGATVSLVGLGPDGHVSSATAYGRHVFEPSFTARGEPLFKPRTCVGKLLAVGLSDRGLQFDIELF